MCKLCIYCGSASFISKILPSPVFRRTIPNGSHTGLSTLFSELFSKFLTWSFSGFRSTASSNAVSSFGSCTRANITDHSFSTRDSYSRLSNGMDQHLYNMQCVQCVQCVSIMQKYIIQPYDSPAHPFWILCPTGCCDQQQFEVATKTYVEKKNAIEN